MLILLFVLSVSYQKSILLHIHHYISTSYINSIDNQMCGGNAREYMVCDYYRVLNINMLASESCSFYVSVRSVL